MSSSSDSIFGITTVGTLIVPTGATNAVFIQPGAYARGTILKFGSGGSFISICGCPNGSSYTGLSLVAGYSNSYPLASTEILSIGGPAQFYLFSTGATSIACLLMGLSQDFTSFVPS